MIRAILSALTVITLCNFGYSQEIAMEVDSGVEDGTFDSVEYPLHHYVAEGGLSEVQELITGGADLNVRNNHGWTPLMFAVENGREEIFNLLVDAGADLNVQEDDGWTALMFAGFHGDNFMVDKLLDSGADALVTNSFGYAAHTITHNREHYDTAAHIASQGVVQAIAHDDINACVSLIREGADVHSHNENGWTALTLAVTLDDYDATKYLVEEKQANVNYLENDGWSPLMFAANNNFVSVTELLLRNGADVNIVSNNGAEAITLARDQGFLELVDILVNNSQSSTDYHNEDTSVVDSHSDDVVSEPDFSSTAVPDAVEEKQGESTQGKTEEKKKGLFGW